MKTSTLIDTNILMDVWGPPDAFSDWSKSQLVACGMEGELVVNEIVWSELAPDGRAFRAFSRTLPECFPSGGNICRGRPHLRLDWRMRVTAVPVGARERPRFPIS